MTVIAPQDTQQTSVSTEKVEANVTQEKIENASQQQQAKQEDQKLPLEDENFKAFREGRKKDRAEREEALRKAAEKEQEIAALKAAMEAAFANKSPAPPPQYYGQVDNGYQPEETEDQKIERKVQAAIAAREAAAQKERLEREQYEYPMRLQQSYPDFQQTISQENLDYLDYHYPEVARPLNRLKDGFDKWSDIYAAIKKFVPNSVNSKREAAKADINHSKPKSLSSTGLTQTQVAPGSHILSEERKAANWARMQSTLKGVGG